jgi:hypothetical protein
MKCIIQVDERGNPVNHPILIDNFLDAFPDVDISSDIPPEGFAWFTRKNQQEEITEQLSLKQVIDCTYAPTLDGKGFQDHFFIRDKTEQELAELYLSIKKPYVTWTLNTDTLQYEPPVPKPEETETEKYMWDDQTVSWIKVTIPVQQ